MEVGTHHNGFFGSLAMDIVRKHDAVWVIVD